MKAPKIVNSVKVAGYTGRKFLGKKLKKVDISVGPDRLTHDDTPFAAEIGRRIPEPKARAAHDTYAPLPFTSRLEPMPECCGEAAFLGADAFLAHNGGSLRAHRNRVPA